MFRISLRGSSAQTGASSKISPQLQAKSNCGYSHLDGKPKVGASEVLLCCSNCNWGNLEIGGLYTARVVESNGLVIAHPMFRDNQPLKLIRIKSHSTFDRLDFLPPGQRDLLEDPTYFYSDSFGLFNLVLKRVG